MGKITESVNKKITNGKGFSLSEMLLAVLILLLATSLVAPTMEMAVEHFYKSTNQSEAQMICNTLSDFVRSELTTAEDIELNGSTLKSFIDESGRIGKRCELKIYNDKLVMCQAGETDASKYYYPVGGATGTYAKGLKLTKFTVTRLREGDRTGVSGNSAKSSVFEVNIEISSNSKVIADSKFFVMSFSE